MLLAIMILGSIYVTSSSFNIIMFEVKKRKTLKILKDNLQIKGYDINKRYIRKIFDCSPDPKSDEKAQQLTELSGLYSPIRNIFININNIQYLCGDYRNNLIWAYYESLSDNIDFLLDNQLIIKNKDAQWYEDRNMALKELEKKYDEIPSKIADKSKDNIGKQIIIDENDSTEELLLKAQILSELIESR